MLEDPSEGAKHSFHAITARAGDGIRTHDNDVGNVVLYQLSYTRALGRAGARRRKNASLDNGVTREEIGELITHLAFYYGWPVANNACQIAAEVFAERDAGD